MRIIWLESSAKALILSESRQHLPNESGGVLLGYANDGVVVVVEALGPGPDARHAPHRFVPDASFHERQIEQRFHESEGALTYLGDWHSHPSGDDLLSKQDRRTLRRIAAEAAAFCPRPLMLIVDGGRLLRWRIVAWEARSCRLGPLVVVNAVRARVVAF